MIRGLESAAAGMRVRQDQQDVIANNLANVSTPGFKRTSVSFQSFSTRAEQAISLHEQSPSSEIPTITAKQDMGPGALTQTGVTSDLALDGPGSFVVRTDTGDVTTRTGNFHVDSSGTIVTAQGFPVLGENGPITVTGGDWTVAQDGSVYSSGAVVGKLKIQPDPAQPNATTSVVSGAIESSNVNVVEEMVSMITAMRAYEANQKTIQAVDQTLDKVINQMGKG